MNKTILAAGCLVLLVSVLYGALLVAEGHKVAGTAAGAPAGAPGHIVPPLERLVQDRTQPTGGVATAYHTISDPPPVKVFQTLYKGGTQIVFNHKEHAEGYGLACIQCHHVENCNKCHLKGETRKMDVSNGKQALHENCIGCHAELGGPAKCPDCHKL